MYTNVRVENGKWIQLSTLNSQLKKGQILLELLVALTLLIFFLTGVVVLELYAIKNTRFAQNKSLATKLAQQQLERARVVRDSSGIDSLNPCKLVPCYINDELTPIPNITPTGTFGQSISIAEDVASECPLPGVTVTPTPILYKATSIVSWGQGAINITPAPQVEVSSCLTDWR